MIPLDPIAEIRALIDGRITAAHPDDWIIRAAERAAKQGTSEVGVLRGAIRLMQDQVDRFTRQPGPTPETDTFEASFCGAPIRIEYSTTEDGVCLHMALVNGIWIDAEEFPGEQCNHWREQIGDALRDAAREHYVEPEAEHV